MKHLSAAHASTKLVAKDMVADTVDEVTSYFYSGVIHLQTNFLGEVTSNYN